MRLERVAVLVALGIGVETRDRSPVPAAAAPCSQNTFHSRSFCRPSITVLPSPAGERAVGVDGGVRGAGARRRRARRRRRSTSGNSSTRPALEHGDVDVAALPGLAALQQRRQDAGVGVHAGGDVGDRAAGLGRRLGRAGDRQETGLALDQQVVGLLVAVGAVVAITRDVADDQPRVLLRARPRTTGPCAPRRRAPGSAPARRRVPSSWSRMSLRLRRA